MNRIPEEEIEWVRTGILQLHDGPCGGLFKWEFELPRPLADWDVFSTWERERFLSMDQHLEDGMVLFDVGTEQGWCNLAYAAMVGPDNMVLVEPTPEFWPNIKQTWERNYYAQPKACYQGLFSNVSNDDRERNFKWPLAAEGWIVDRNRYQYIHDNDGVPQIMLDDFVKRSGVLPNAITLDVEGAEYHVLAGALQTLSEYRPLVWASLHPDLGKRDYNVEPQDTIDLMQSVGYKAKHIGSDHEEHWFFS